MLIEVNTVWRRLCFSFATKLNILVRSSYCAVIMKLRLYRVYTDFMMNANVGR